MTRCQLSSYISDGFLDKDMASDSEKMLRRISLLGIALCEYKERTSMLETQGDTVIGIELESP
jgi:hypothetical protein